MRIKRLEIFGFKSFAERAVVQFDTGVTGIVGPNGCGKSNVVDALRWVMGEQSAKNLRGGTMQDIIFNGSAGKKALGFAEVVLTLENTGNSFPAEFEHFSEIEVARRLYRNGDSEYELNKRPCRLKDITELFLGTGVGTRAYSIIEQGRVNELVQAKPEDRRNIIEEAAGITKYKAKRTYAQRKMEATEQNLARVEDILGELSGRLSTLKRQAQKAERSKELHKDLKGLELHQGALKFLEEKAVFRFIEHKQTDLESRQSLGKTALLDLSQDSAQKQKMLQGKEENLRLSEKMQLQTQSQADLGRQDVQFKQESLTQRKNHGNHLKTEITRVEARHTEIQVEKNTAIEKEAFEKVQKEKADEILREKALLQQVAKEALDKTSRDCVARRQALSDYSEEAQRNQLESQSLTSRLDHAKSRNDALSEEQKLLRHQGQLAQESLSQVQNELEQGNNKKSHLENELEQLRLKLDATKVKISEVAIQKNTTREAFVNKQSRLASLKEIENRLFARNQKNPQKEEAVLEQTLGAMAEFVQVPQALEEALEKGLATLLRGRLVKDNEELLAVLEDFGEGDSFSEPLFLGTAGLSQESVTSDLGQKAKPLAEELTFLAYPEKLRNFFYRIWLCDNLQDAFELLPLAQTHGISLLTRQGEYLGANGVLSLDSSKGGAGLLSRKREIRELELKVVALEKESLACSDKFEELQISKTAVQGELAAKKTELETLMLALARFSEMSRSKKDEVHKSDQKLMDLNVENEKHSLLLKVSQGKLEEFNQSWAKALEAHKTLSLELDQFVVLERNAQKEFEDAREALTEKRVSLTSVGERYHAICQNLRQLEGREAEYKGQLQKLNEQLEGNLSETDALVQQRLLGEEKLKELQAKIAQGETELATEREQVSVHKSAFFSANEERKKCEGLLNEVQGALIELNLKRKESEMMLIALDERLMERHSISAEKLLSDYHHLPIPKEDFDGSIEALKRSIKMLGAINESAIEEYDETHERHEFLAGQSEDLRSALEQLASAIHKINQTTIERFKIAFDAINERFGQVFPRLFRGGSAWLELSQPDDILNSGVEIFAQPPGKKLGSIALMSGGEKALTATSLIFAIFLVKPSPFCLLDEVDAPLDEANVDRFSQMVKEMATISQFIVITHNKKTMERSDRLYGVTMEEAGISKVVSVKVLEEGAIEQKTPASSAPKTLIE